MTPKQAYSALLHLYPAAFRREFGDEMREVFCHMERAHHGSRVGFWLFVLNDLSRSVLSAQFDACRSDSRRFSLTWVGFCASGAIATALLANALTAGFSYLYHPYLEGVALPPWSYGTLLGVTLGTAQTAVLRTRVRPRLLWVLASGLGAAIGLEVAIVTAKVAGPIGYGIVLGCVVGSVQWAVLRTHVRQTVWWRLASTVAVSLAMFSTSGAFGVGAHARPNPSRCMGLIRENAETPGPRARLGERDHFEASSTSRTLRASASGAYGFCKKAVPALNTPRSTMAVSVYPDV